MTRRRGRPPKRAADRLSASIKAGFTAREADALHLLALRQGCDVSTLVRLACRHVLLDARGAALVISRP